MAADGMVARRRSDDQGRRNRREPEPEPEQQLSSYSSGYSASNKIVKYGVRDRDNIVGWAAPTDGCAGSQDKMSLPVALQGLQDASEASEWACRCACAVLENPSAGRIDMETVLQKLKSWLSPSPERQVITQLIAAAIPAAVVRAVRKFRSEPLAAALGCVVIVRSSGSGEGAAAYLRAAALEEVVALMDRHPSHGGMQNVCLLVLCGLVKDATAARQAISLGLVTRVLRAMEATQGREVQLNGLSALRLLTENGRSQRLGVQQDAALKAKVDAALRAKVAHQYDTTICEIADDVLAMVTPRFKEELCWHWESGFCKLGPRCTYAHGRADLRPQ